MDAEGKESISLLGAVTLFLASAVRNPLSCTDPQELPGAALGS